jgi:hypothetical protein
MRRQLSQRDPMLCIGMFDLSLFKFSLLGAED